MSSVTPAETAKQELGAAFEGELIGPDDAGYDEARALFNAMIDKRPAADRALRNRDDVARDRRLRARARPAAGDPRRRPQRRRPRQRRRRRRRSTSRRCARSRSTRRRETVRVGGGATWAEVDAATHEHGLAVPCGVISTTGVGGLTLGGGIGHLTRGYGLTIDNLLAAEVVLRRRPASSPRAPTRTRSSSGRCAAAAATSASSRSSRSGRIRSPTSSAARRSGRSSRPTSCSPRTASSCPRCRGTRRGFFCFHTVPPGAAVPGGDPPAQGLRDRLVHRGHRTRRRRRRWRRCSPSATPLMHGVAADAAPGAEQRVRRSLRPRRPVVLARRLRQRDPRRGDRAERGVERARCRRWKSGSHIYPIDGAAHDVGATDTPWAYRDTRWAQVIIGVDPDPAGAPALRDWTVGYWEALHPYSAGGAYVNFMMDEGQERVKATYGEQLRPPRAREGGRTTRTTVFRVNQNIPPAA